VIACDPFCTGSLKSRVTVIARLRIIVQAAFDAACSPPTTLSPFDVALLALLGATHEQDHQRLAVAPEYTR
jgi:hypothetical protein